MDKCSICGNTIAIQIFKGTGLCSDNCRKVAANEAEYQAGAVSGAVRSGSTERVKPARKRVRNTEVA